jgi:CRISPR-associated protein (Cas_Cmr3)
MSKNVLLQFRPLDAYFFGSELTHGDGGANYFAKSNRMPQQTTLCGTIRHILLQLGYPIGPQGFSPDVDQPFGALHSLSPVFLTNQNKDESAKHFLRSPIDRYTAKGTPFQLKRSADTAFISERRAGWYTGSLWDIPDHKRGAADEWIAADGSETAQSDNIFMPLIRPGITKNRSGSSSNTKSFYKRSSYELSAGWSFGVMARLDDSVDITKINGVTIPVGAEGVVCARGRHVLLQ